MVLLVLRLLLVFIQNNMKENKELLLRYLSMALPYKTMCDMGLEHPMQLQRIFIDERDGILLDFYTNKNVYQVYLSEVKPYLRPLSSITEEERLEISNLIKHDVLKNPFGKINPKGMDNLLHSVIVSSSSLIKWLLEKHFDFMELASKDLAIEITKENNPYK